MRVWWIFLILAVAVLIPFLIWGEGFEEMFSSEGAKRWLLNYGSWAWAAGCGLLILDLFLPLPSTTIMSGLGYVYGAWLGGLIAAAGSILSGLLAYGLCRALGQRAAEFIAGKEDLAKGRRVFAKGGGWLVALSRALPIFPEVIACMAGMTRMPFHKFVISLACGSLPTGLIYAAVGTAGPLAIALSLLVPGVLWLGLKPVIEWHSRAGEEDEVSVESESGPEP